MLHLHSTENTWKVAESLLPIGFPSTAEVVNAGRALHMLLNKDEIAALKKKSEAVMRAQKKQKKSKAGSNDQHIASKALDSSLLELTKNLKVLQETEKMACRKALIEERSRY